MTSAAALISGPKCGDAMNSTISLGEANPEACLDHATFMILHNYHRHLQPAGSLQPESRQALADVERYWDIITTANIGTEKPSGFYASLYMPKDGNSCPPTLALRGTVFEDFRGIAVGIRCKAYPAFAPNRAAEFAFGVAPGYSPPDRYTVTSADHPDGVSQNAAPMRATFMSDLTSQGSWLELFTHRNLNTTVQRRIGIVPPGIAQLIPRDLREIALDSTVEVWLSEDHGDWATNVRQGIGEDTTQYNQELKGAVNDALREVQRTEANALRITGHSLGGGLASAAALYAKAMQPEMRIWGLGYDSAGVHEETARRLGTSTRRAAEANIVTRAVQDEILTSLEKDSDFVPLASSIIRFTGSKMPPPIGTIVERRGVSPGVVGATAYADKWAAMPNLLPLENQTLHSDPDAVATWANLAGIFASSRDLGQAMDRLSAEINRRVEAVNAQRAAGEAAEDLAEELSEADEARREAEAERQEALREAEEERREAAREAEEERREAESEAAAARAEAEAEASEPEAWYYNLYDEPRDLLRRAGDGLSNIGDAIGDVASDVADEAGDLGRDIADEAGDLGREVLDETADLGSAIYDGAGDALNYAYRHTAQYMVEFGRYGYGLGTEFSDFIAIMKAVADYHSDELATFTFVFKTPS